MCARGPWQDLGFRKSNNVHCFVVVIVVWVGGGDGGGGGGGGWGEGRGQVVEGSRSHTG